MSLLKKDFIDLYAILNLSFGAGFLDLKKNFRLLAKKYHPDNPNTGSRDRFLRILTAYRMLEDPGIKEKYDIEYKKRIDLSKNIVKTIPPDRIFYTASISKLAKYGLMRVGLRNRERSKLAGINYDADIFLKKEELEENILIKYPLTARILCPECHGSDIYCPSCNGRGSYKGTRFLQIGFKPGQVLLDRIYEFQLSSFRPDRFVHFKKKFLRIKLRLI